LPLPLVTCPGLFYGSEAQDGILSRMRIPGGILNYAQALAIADLIDQYAADYVQVTNRANLQIRGLAENIHPDVFSNLQKLGISSRLLEIDPIRNIMASPTAGIDPQQLLDTRPLVQAFDNYLQSHPELAALSPKFSVGFDGGELVSICDRRNDITLVAQHSPAHDYSFRLYLNLDGKNSFDTGVVIWANYLSVLAALTQVYLTYCSSQPQSQRKPRLRHLLADWGVEAYLEKVECYLELTWQRMTEERTQVGQNYNHLGIHQQHQPGLSYIGIALPLGRLASQQLRELADLAQIYGNGTIRLTPWQNLLLSDLPNSQLPEIKQCLGLREFNWEATRLDSTMVACAGSTGCASAATDTQSQALALARDFRQRLKLDQPINIHFSGCEKSCAQHHPSDIALVGNQAMIDSYDVYVGTGESSFGRQILQAVGAAQIPGLIEQLLRIYQEKRSACTKATLSPFESFQVFINRQNLAELQQWLNHGTLNSLSSLASDL
jgi:ferredoxin-nitrite reductase